MSSSRRPNHCNITILHIDSQIHGIVSPVAFGSRICSCLLRNEGLGFALQWKKSSNKPIFLNKDSVYFSEDRACYSLSGQSRKKSKLFHFEVEDVSEFGSCRAKASLFYNLPDNGRPHASCFLTLRNNSLVRHCNRTGKILDKIFLGSLFNFSNMEVEADGHLVLQSVCFYKFGTRNTNTIQAILIMSLCPLKFLYQFELTTAVAGHDVKVVRVSNGMLLLGATSCTRVYSLNHVLASGRRLCSCDIGDDCVHGHGWAGMYPDGLPVNFEVLQLPAMLLEVRSKPKDVSFGCIPLHCLFTPSNQQKVFSLIRVSDERREEMDVDAPTIFDQCTFHPTLPNVLIYQSNHSLTCYKYSSDKLAFIELFRIKTDELQNPTLCIRERRGDRPVRSTAFTGSFLTHARTMFEHNYDSSLNLHLLRAVSSNEISHSSIFVYTVDGQMIREVKIKQLLKKAAICSFAMSLDRLAVVEHEGGFFHLQVYQLQRTAEFDRKTIISI